MLSPEEDRARRAHYARFDLALASAQSGLAADEFARIRPDEMFLCREGYWHESSNCIRVRPDRLGRPWAGPVRPGDAPAPIAPKRRLAPSEIASRLFVVSQTTGEAIPAYR